MSIENHTDQQALALSAQTPHLFAWHRPLGIWHLENPNAAQIRLFLDAGIPLPSQAYNAPESVMELAGATFYSDITQCPAAKEVLQIEALACRRASILAWNKGGVWVIETPNDHQWRMISESAVPDDPESDEWAALLERAGATFYERPEDCEVTRGMKERMDGAEADFQA